MQRYRATFLQESRGSLIVKDERCLSALFSVVRDCPGEAQARAQNSSFPSFPRVFRAANFVVRFRSLPNVSARCAGRDLQQVYDHPGM